MVEEVIYKLLMITAVNAFIIYNEVRRKKIQFLEFLVALAENLIQQGKSKPVWREFNVWTIIKEAKINAECEAEKEKVYNMFTKEDREADKKYLSNM